MGRYKYLFKNIGLLTLSSFGTKLLSFFLVPLYTNILTTAQYGAYDMFNTTIGVLIPILTLNIQESVLRFALDKHYRRDAIVTVATRFLLLGSGLVLAGLAVNVVFSFSELVRTYSVYFFLMYFSQVLSGLVLAYIRGIDKIAALSVSSILCSVVTLGLNILFLVVLKWGLEGYFLANILGPLAQCAYLIARGRIPGQVHLRTSYAEQSAEMLAYCKPLIANSIGWWINNASDRYIVVYFCGLAENGVYSVASKIPSILNIFQTIFNQAWTLSAVKDFDPEDSSGFFSTTYRVYNSLMTILCAGIIFADKLLAKFLYAKDFFVAWRYVPWLTMAILFGALSGLIGGIFSAVKNSKIFAQSTIIGAVANLLMNVLLTPVMGPLGAAIATTVSYVLVWAMRMMHARRYIRLKLHLVRDIVSYGLLLVQSVLLLMLDGLTMYLVEGGLVLVILALNLKDLLPLVAKLLKKGDAGSHEPS